MWMIPNGSSVVNDSTRSTVDHLIAGEIEHSTYVPKLVLGFCHHIKHEGGMLRVYACAIQAGMRPPGWSRSRNPVAQGADAADVDLDFIAGLHRPYP